MILRLDFIRYVRYDTKLNLNIVIPAWNHFLIDENIHKDNPLNVKHIRSIGNNYVPTDILANHMLHWNYTGAANLIALSSRLLPFFGIL